MHARIYTRASAVRTASMLTQHACIQLNADARTYIPRHCAHCDMHPCRMCTKLKCMIRLLLIRTAATTCISHGRVPCVASGLQINVMIKRI